MASRLHGENAEDPQNLGDTLIILPTYNESGTLAELVSRIHETVPEAAVLIIDDASPDGTGRIADTLAEDPRVSVIHRPGKQGLGTAYVAGFEHALAEGFRWVVEMDADGSHLPEELPRLTRAARSGAGLVIGARWVPGGAIEGWPWYRRLLSRGGTFVARVALRSRLHDITSGYRLIDTRWLALLDLSRLAMQGYGFQVEIAWSLERVACPVAEVPITFVERSSGTSKMTPAIVFEALRLVLAWGWQIRFSRANRRPVK